MNVDGKKIYGFEGLQILQRAEVKILAELDKYCKSRELVYYLGYGTLLGAVRHSGFIPWDDDIDICMPRHDYQQLLSEFKQFFPPEYKLNHYSKEEFTTNTFPLRICNPSIRFIRKINGKDKVFDSFISIFPIDGMPKTRFRRLLLEKNVDIQYTFIRFARSTQNGYGDVEHTLKEKLGILINSVFRIGYNADLRKLAKKIDKTLAKYPISNSNYVSTYGYMITPMCYLMDYFGKPKELMFEGSMFNVPEQYEKLLEIWYGDYMTLPPIEKRKPSHSLDIIV